MSAIDIRPGSESTSASWASYAIPAASKAARVAAASLVSSMSSPFVSSAMPTIPAMFTPRSASAVAIRASAPGRSSSLTVNQTDTGAPPVFGRWYPATVAPTDRADTITADGGAERPDLRPRARPGDARRDALLQGAPDRDPPRRRDPQADRP